MGEVNAGLMLRFKDADYLRPPVNIYYSFRPLRLPVSWGNEGRGGVDVGPASGQAVLVRAFSGPRWLKAGQALDFNFEFSDTEVSLPQVVGHTTSSRGGARSRGRSWCLDGSQTCYGILREDGQLSVVNPPT